MLFHQKKYGLAEAKYATLGGLFDEGETPEQCAHRYFYTILQYTILAPLP
jgi:ADP-ribose pyrophosphatase YjhB (NUDIX family)